MVHSLRSSPKFSDGFRVVSFATSADTAQSFKIFVIKDCQSALALNEESSDSVDAYLHHYELTALALETFPISQLRDGLWDILFGLRAS